MLTASDAARVEKLIAEFDFETVARVMDLLDWVWGEPSKRPTIAEMRECARELLSDVCQSDERPDWSTGGFAAARYGDGRLSLGFIVTDVMEATDAD